MAKENIKEWHKRAVKRTMEILDEESMEVSQAVGKLAKSWDIVSHDHVCWKLTRVFLDSVPRIELKQMLKYNISPYGIGTEIQIFIYKKRHRKPLARPKLQYNKPNQDLPDGMKPYLS